jgi:DNA-binding transcriptional regulator PaaX
MSGITPKTSAKFMTWCINSALNLLIDYVKSKQKPLRQEDLSGYFRDQLTDYGISNRQISRVVYDLKRRNYIVFDEGDSVKFTDKAKIKLIDKFVSINPADRKRRLVSFDIPETKRRQRNAFRQSIKQMGFRQIQKSLWVCDRNTGDMVEVASKEFGVDEYVAYFVVESSNIDKYINRILAKPKKKEQKFITGILTIVQISTTEIKVQLALGYDRNIDDRR